MSPHIAVTGVGAVTGLGVVKSIRHSEKFKRSRITGLDCNGDSIGFFICDNSHILEKVAAPGYIDSLIKICRLERVDAFMPLIEEEFILVHDNMERFHEVGTKVIIQPREIVETFLDKYGTAMALKKAGVMTPETHLLLPKNRDRISAMTEKYGFPLFAKPRRSRSSKGLIRINSQKQLDMYIELLKDENYIVQEYLADDDQEYTSAIFKTPSMSEPYMISLKRQLLNGTTVSAEVVFDDAIAEACARIASRFPIEGSINVQLRKKDGVPYIFEVNPRYSSTTYIRTLCGFNDTEMGLEYELYGKTGGKPSIEKLKVIRYFEERCLTYA